MPMKVLDEQVTLKKQQWRSEKCQGHFFTWTSDSQETTMKVRKCKWRLQMNKWLSRNSSEGSRKNRARVSDHCRTLSDHVGPCRTMVSYPPSWFAKRCLGTQMEIPECFVLHLFFLIPPGESWPHPEKTWFDTMVRHGPTWSDMVRQWSDTGGGLTLWSQRCPKTKVKISEDNRNIQTVFETSQVKVHQLKVHRIQQN